MEHDKYVKMRKIAKRAGTWEELKHIDTYFGLLIFLMFIFIAYLLIIHNPLTIYKNSEIINQSNKITQGLNNTQLIQKFASNSTALATYSLAAYILSITVSEVSIASGIIIFGYVVLIMFNDIHRPDYYIALKEARRAGLFKAGYTESDVAEFRAEIEKERELI